MFRLQALVHGMGGSFQDRATPSPQGNVDSPNASFAETCPNFLAWQYEIINLDGSYSFMNLD